MTGQKWWKKGGLKIKNILCSKNPFKKTNCEQKMCPLCFNSEFVVVSDEEPKVSCNTNNVGYKWQCVTCQENNLVKVYEGETGRSARLRGAEHLSQLKLKSKVSVLYKHKVAAHPYEQVKFKMEITSRQANEAVHICRRPAKSKFNHPARQVTKSIFFVKIFKCKSKYKGKSH